MHVCINMYGIHPFSFVIWLLLLFCIFPATTFASIPVPQIQVTPTQSNQQVVVGSEITLAAKLDNTNIIGYGPFLELYVPSGCYQLESVRSSYEEFIQMPTPTITSFATTRCVNDPIISTVLPLTSRCSAARQICGQANSRIYTWQLPFMSYDVQQENNYYFKFKVLAECTETPTIRAGFKYLSYQNDQLVTVGNPDLVNCQTDSTQAILNKITGTSPYTAREGPKWAPWKVTSGFISSSSNNTGPFLLTDTSPQTYTFRWTSATGTSFTPNSLTGVMEIPPCFVITTITPSDPGTQYTVTPTSEGGYIINATYTQPITGDSAGIHDIQVNYTFDPLCAENRCGGYCPGNQYQANFVSYLHLKCPNETQACCFCGTNKTSLSPSGTINGTTTTSSITAAGIRIVQTGTFNLYGMDRPIGSICWNNEISCNTGALDFYNQSLVNVIPDGLDATPANMTSSNNGSAGTFLFTYENQATGVLTSVEVPITPPFVEIPPASPSDGIHYMRVNISAVFAYLGVANATSICAKSIGYCTGVNQFYSVTGKAVSDCSSFPNSAKITTDVYFTNGTLAQEQLAATSGSSVSISVPRDIRQPIHTLVGYGGAGWGINPDANTLCGSLADFKDPNQPNFQCDRATTNIPLNTTLTYRVLWDSPFSSEPDGFRMSLYPPFPSIPSFPPGSLAIKTSSDYNSPTTLPPLGECWIGPTDNYTSFYASQTGHPPTITVESVDSTPSGNQIIINYPADATIPPGASRRVDLLCTLQTIDRQVSSSELPLASQWNWYPDNPTSACRAVQSYTSYSEVTPVGKVGLKKYIIDFFSGGDTSRLRYNNAAPSICQGTFVGDCGGVLPYDQGVTMRVDPSRLISLPAGPTSVTNAPRGFAVTYALLVYNQGLANAYDIEITDVIGKGSAAHIAPIVAGAFQANWADTGLSVPGNFTYDNGILKFIADPSVFLPASNGSYTSSSAILVTFDALYDGKGPGCQIKNTATLSGYAAVPGGVNQATNQTSNTATIGVTGLASSSSLTAAIPQAPIVNGATAAGAPFIVLYCETFLDQLDNFTWVIPNPLGNIFDVHISPDYGQSIEVFKDYAGPLPGGIYDNYKVSQGSDGTFYVSPATAGLYSLYSFGNTNPYKFCIDVSYYMPNQNPYKPEVQTTFDNSECTSPNKIVASIKLLDPSMSIGLTRNPFAGSCTPGSVGSYEISYLFNVSYLYPTYPRPVYPSCTVNIRTDKVDVLHVPSAPGNWTLASSTNGSLTTYVYKSETATSYPNSPLPFNFSVQEKPGVTDAYQTPDLLDMVCVYQTFENTTLGNVTNENQIVYLSTTASSSNLPVLQQCPTARPTHLPTFRPTRLPTHVPSKIPTRPTQRPTFLPTTEPTERPSMHPSQVGPIMDKLTLPSKQFDYRLSFRTWTSFKLQQPSRSPTRLPTLAPTHAPSVLPTVRPSKQPSEVPTHIPSKVPTDRPSQFPTLSPTARPTHRPSTKPTHRPSLAPTSKPSKQPSQIPSRIPSKVPTEKPSRLPTLSPTGKPSRVPTGQPSRRPTRTPTERPSRLPTDQPSRRPTRLPTDQPSKIPSQQPSARPSRSPTSLPTQQPTSPTPDPTPAPTTPYIPNPYIKKGDICHPEVIMHSLNGTIITPDTCYQACYNYYFPSDSYFFFFNIYPPDSIKPQTLVCSCSLTCVDHIKVPFSHSYVVNKGTDAPTMQPTSTYQCTNGNLTLKSKVTGLAIKKKQKKDEKVKKAKGRKDSHVYVAKVGQKFVYEMTLHNPDKYDEVENVGLQLKLPPEVKYIDSKVSPRRKGKKGGVRRTKSPDGTTVLTWCDYLLGKKKSVKYTIKLQVRNGAVAEEAITLEATTFQSPAPCSNDDLNCQRPVSEVAMTIEESKSKSNNSNNKSHDKRDLGEEEEEEEEKDGDPLEMYFSEEVATTADDLD